MFAALLLSLHTTRPFGIHGQCNGLLNSAARDTHTLNWPVPLLLADLGICQHGLEATKQTVCWHTPWEKINSFCECQVTTQTVVFFRSAKYFELQSLVTRDSTPALSFL